MIRTDEQGDVTELVLGRVEARNAIDPAWVTSLGDAVAAIAAAPPRALLIRAEGPAFSVGGDLAHFNAHLDRLDAELGDMIEGFHRSLLTIAGFPFPVVCAVQGPVAGGGLGLLWASDVILLAADAKLVTAFTKLGLSGDGGSSWYLPRMVGERRALQLMLGGGVLSAEQALELALADAVVPGAELESAARERAAALAAGPTLAYATIRQLIRGAGSRTAMEGLDAELEACVRLGATRDARDGFAAFLAQRRPEFHGR